MSKSAFRVGTGGAHEQQNLANRNLVYASYLRSSVFAPPPPLPQPRSQAPYHNHAAKLGYQKKGAVPLEQTEMLQLLHHLCQDLKSAPLEQQLP